MRLLKNRRLHVNMGHFEHVEVTVTVDVDTIADAETLTELGIDPTDPDAVTDFIDEQIELMLSADVEELHYTTDESDSFIHEYEKNKGKKN